MKSYHGNKAGWPWPSFKGHKGHRKVNIKLTQAIDEESIPLKFQSSAIDLWRIIVVTCEVDLDLVARVIKVPERLTSNSSSYWWGEQPCTVSKLYHQSLKGYCGNKAGWPWPSFKGHKGHRKVNIKLTQAIDEESMPVKFQSSAINLWRVIMVTSEVDLDLFARVI